MHSPPDDLGEKGEKKNPKH